MKKIIFLLIIAVLVVALFGCSKQENKQEDSAPVKVSESFDIEIRDFSFSQNEHRVFAGDTVTWINEDNALHTVTSNTGNELNSEALEKGQKYSHTFLESGIYEYYCNFHPGMKAKVIVIDTPVTTN